MIPRDSKDTVQGTFTGININTDLFDQKDDSEPSITSADDKTKISAEKKPLIIAFTQTTQCKDELEKIKSHYEVIPINDKDGFESISQANRAQNPILIIDVGEECCKENIVQIATRAKEKFPSNTRIATGKVLGEVGKLKFNNLLACEIVKTYKELSSFLIQRRDLQTKRIAVTN
jgi:hypothetical protein